MNIINKINVKLNGNKKWFVSGIILVLILGGVFLWQKTGIMEILTSFLGIVEKAEMKISPSSGAYNVGQAFTIEVILDTKGKNVVAAAAYLKYDPATIEVSAINTLDASSPFNSANDCQFGGKPCEIVNHNASAGAIEIVKAKPTPGVNGSNIKIATLTLKGKKAVSPTADNFSFDFTGAYQGKSRVILDDGKGTDILSRVENARFNIVVPSAVPAAPSNLLFDNITKTGARLYWTDNSNNEDGFYIYRSSQNQKPANPYHTNTANDTDYTDGDQIPPEEAMVCGATYYYWLEAYNSAGKSSAASGSVKTAACAPETYNPDLNNDGKVSPTDATKYIQLWHQKSLLVDVDKNGSITGTDATKYVQLWHQAQAQ